MYQKLEGAVTSSGWGGGDDVIDDADSDGIQNLVVRDGLIDGAG